MQTAVIITDLIISVMAFISIRLQNKNANTKIWESVNKTVIPGASVGLLTVAFVVRPVGITEVISVMLLGVVVSEIINIFYLTAKTARREERATVYYDDGTPTRYFITGDKHRNFDYVKAFCTDMCTRRRDVLIILGDAGFNYYGDKRDDKLKQEISNLNITLFCLHGNKENRPQNVGTYGIRSFCGSKVYYEPRYPNILFAIDGEVYTFEGRKYMVLGGAHSVDKMHCLEEGRPFWEDEMPDDITKAKVESALMKENNSVYGMMTHTCPIDYLPTEMFVSTRQNAVIKRKPRRIKSKKRFKPDIDRSTEEWLGNIEKRVNYEVWFCGHYHIDKQIDRINMMYREIRPLHHGVPWREMPLKL